MKLRPLSKEELSLSYSKYYYMPDPPLDAAQLALANININPEDAMRPEDVHRMAAPGYLKDEIGSCVLPDGTEYYASYSHFKGVTVEMLDWWFVWHFIGPNRDIVPEEQGNLRYKIWCPRMHWDTYYTTQEGRKKAMDDTLPYWYRKVDNEYKVIEALDWSRPDEFSIQYGNCDDPRKFGFKESELMDPKVGSITTCFHTHTNLFMAQQIRPTFDGCESRFRMWFGLTEFKNGAFNKVPVTKESKACVTNEEPHSGEFDRFPYFLPQLFAEESGKPLDAY